MSGPSEGGSAQPFFAFDFLSSLDENVGSYLEHKGPSLFAIDWYYFQLKRFAFRKVGFLNFFLKCFFLAPAILPFGLFPSSKDVNFL